jgi:indolepyruvate ferredoxin oxidoreductase beta subunit
MSQRGGSVTSHVRWGRTIYSPLIGAGEVDVLMAFEKLEALRNIHSIRPKALVLINDHSILPLTVISGDGIYPSDEILRKAFSRVSSHVEYIRGEEIAGSLGNLRVANVVLLGALSSLLERSSLSSSKCTPEIWFKVISERVPSKYIDLNRSAFQAGRDAVGS